MLLCYVRSALGDASCEVSCEYDSLEDPDVCRSVCESGTCPLMENELSAVTE